MKEILKELETVINRKSNPTKHTEYKVKYQRLRKDIKDIIKKYAEVRK